MPHSLPRPSRAVTSSTTTRMQSPDSRPSILALTSRNARSFLLQSSQYCDLELPPYFVFSDLLTQTASVLNTKSLYSLSKNRPSQLPGVNYRLYANKDGRYAWRPLDLIHPAIYVSLVNAITLPENWAAIRERFKIFRSTTEPNIKCLSIPVLPSPHEKVRAGQIGHWWERVEQTSIQLSLDYEFLIHTDITDCYSAIYTHSIPWALHGKSHAKSNSDDSNLLGNTIDLHIRDMRHGQTNGIPQGSTLMDFLAEVVLAYSDTELADHIRSQSIDDYQILRYRDDYRIFVNNPQDGERILKCLAEVLTDLGMRLSPDKTQTSTEVIRSSIKRDKLAYAFRRQRDRNLERHLLIIHDHATQYPNSGSLLNALKDYHRLISESQQPRFPLTLISIVVDIAYRNPRTYSVAAAILSHLIQFLSSNDEKRSVIERIKGRFSKIPNTGYLEIWIQRISHRFSPDSEFDEGLCKLVQQKDVQIWDSQWISSKDLLKAVDPSRIVDRAALQRISPIVPTSEVELFPPGYS